ncbi:MAG TPA: hypothetical protein PLX77_02085 [Candidatus Cloacimonadota bacterium]|nr:hypothetical protein [Candidatus Cloacimonadota bacterium]
MKLSILLEEPESLDFEPGTQRSGEAYDFWYNPHFMHAIASLHDLKPLLLRVYKGEELVALLPLYERKKLSLKALICPVGAYYQGLHTFYPAGASPNRMLLDTYAISEGVALFLSQHYGRISFKLTPRNTDVRAFTRNKYRAMPVYTFTYPTSSTLHMLPDEKKKLRIAEKHGMQIDEIFDPDTFMKLQRSLDSRKKHSLGTDLKDLGKFFERLHDRGLLKQINVLHESRVVSSNILFYDGGEIAYTVFMASEAAAMPLGVSTFHNVKLLSAMPEACQLLDYCGANVPEVARFKAALGLNLQVFYHVSR